MVIKLSMGNIKFFYTNIIKDGAIAAGLCPKIAEPHPMFCKYNGK